MAGYWPFDEGTGTTTADLSGNGNYGTLVNSPTWEGGSSCKFGDCLSFATDQYVTTNSIPTSNATDSVSVWAKFNSIQSVNNMLFVNGDNSGNRQMSLVYVSAGLLYFVVDNALTYAYTPWSPSTGTWYNVAATFNSGTFAIYINGVSQTIIVPGSSSTIGSSYGTTYMGYDSANNAYLNGLLDDVRIYPSALSAAQVYQVYTQPPSSTSPSTTTTVQSVTSTGSTTTASVITSTTSVTTSSTTTTTSTAACTGSDGGLFVSTNINATVVVSICGNQYPIPAGVEGGLDFAYHSGGVTLVAPSSAGGKTFEFWYVTLPSQQEQVTSPSLFIYVLPGYTPTNALIEAVYG